MTPGNIVLINGTSSSGKTTIANALQQMMPEPYYIFGVDLLQPGFPPGAIRYTNTDEDDLPEGWEILFRNGVVERVIPGSGAIRFLGGLYRAIVAFASAGNNVIVDDVIFHPAILGAALDELHASNVLFVGIVLPLDVVEQRERERGNRAVGGARAFFDSVHVHQRYDLVLDDPEMPPEGCARLIKQALDQNLPRRALADLWQQVQDE